jgi:molybdenum-dependent DNA-binding transcriptional regulator ModE
MEASSAGGEIWDAVRRSWKRPLLCSQIWDDRLADTQTDRRTGRKSGFTANSYRFAHALISRWRLISEASLPVFRRNRGWGRISDLCNLTCLFMLEI